MSTTTVTESTVFKVGDRVQIGSGSNLWRITYIHGDGNMTMVTANAKRNYVHPNRVTQVFDSEG